jgi:hypothetical protein
LLTELWTLAPDTGTPVLPFSHCHAQPMSTR